MLDTYSAHTVHTVHTLARAKYAEYVPSMRLDDGTTGPTHRSCQIATTALSPAAVSTLASATSAMIGRTKYPNGALAWPGPHNSPATKSLTAKNAKHTKKSY